MVNEQEIFWRNFFLFHKKLLLNTNLIKHQIFKQKSDNLLFHYTVKQKKDSDFVLNQAE